MLSKCSNPSCSASFLYLHSGKLFRLPRRKPRAENGPRRDTVEFFWLCQECATRYTLKADEQLEVRVVELPRLAAAATASL